MADRGDLIRRGCERGVPGEIWTAVTRPELLTSVVNMCDGRRVPDDRPVHPVRRRRAILNSRRVLSTQGRPDTAPSRVDILSTFEGGESQ